MGYYDGAANTTTASSYQLAQETKTPVVLILDCRGMSLSAAAIVKGMVEFRPDSGIKAVILNRIKPMQYRFMKDLLENELRIPVLGYLPFREDCVIQSRHLGLVTAGEIEDLKNLLEKLAEQAEKTIDLDALLALADTASELEPEPVLPPVCCENHPRIAVARDEAFCFYYQDSLDLLSELGAELVTFSPLYDTVLPENCCGMILGGGYPELYTRRLSQNAEMLQEIRGALADQMPCIAECGGFLYLSRSMEDINGNEYKLVGAIDSTSRKSDALHRFGYIEMTARFDNLLCKKGERIRAHEFHYWESSDNGNSFTAKKPFREMSWDCVHCSDSLYAGYPHLHFYANPVLAENFVKKCGEFGRRKHG